MIVDIGAYISLPILALDTSGLRDILKHDHPDAPRLRGMLHSEKQSIHTHRHHLRSVDRVYPPPGSLLQGVIAAGLPFVRVRG